MLHLSIDISFILCERFINIPLTTCIQDVHIVFTGPESWWVHFPAAAGTEQSPVDIRREEAEFLPCLKNSPLKICYEDRSHKRIRNNGHTCIVDVGGMSCKYNYLIEFLIEHLYSVIDC